MAEGAPNSIITQVSRDSDSYAPCPAPIDTRGTNMWALYCVL